MAKEDSDYRSERPGAARRADVVRPDADVPDDLDERAVDLETGEDEDQQFRRAPRRIPVRRGPLPARAATRLRYALMGVLIFAILGLAATSTYRYGARSWRFRLDSSDNVELQGSQNVSRTQVMEIMGADIGRNVFFVPLEDRKRQLEEIPWVESATVMRLLPNRIRVSLRERTPVAFVQIGSKVSLIDGSGVVMELPAKAQSHYSFPVIVGTAESEPLSTRAARMKIYTRLIRELATDGGAYSTRLSEVDLSDPDDVKAMVSDPAGAVLIHLGSSNFLDRFKLYIAHGAEWRQQFPNLQSVDLRYDRQIIVNPDAAGPAPAPSTSEPPAHTASAPPKPVAHKTKHHSKRP